MINIIKSAFILISAIIGAAFASGKEIQIFFNNENAWFSLIANGIMFTILPFILYCKLIKYNLNTYSEFVNITFKKTGKAVLLISVVFTFATYLTMINAAKIVMPFGSIILTILCAITLTFDFKGIEILSFIATPIMIIGIILNSIMTIKCSAFYEIKSYTYSAYNILSAFPLMCCMRKYIPTKKEALITSALSGSVLAILMIMIYVSVKNINSPMPMLHLSKENNIFIFYSFIMFCAIFTTAVSSGKGFAESIKIDRKPAVYFLTACGLIFSFIKFETLLAVITTIFGFIGLITVLYSIFKV